MAKTNVKALGDERTKQVSGVPTVVGLRHLGNLFGLTDVDTSNSYMVFLDKTNPEHVTKLIKFIKTLDGQRTKDDSKTKRKPM